MMDLMQAGLALEKFIDIGSEARPADRDHARQAFRILCEAIRVANEENARVRDLAHRSDLPPDVVRGIERLREDLSAAVFAGREWKDKAQDKIAEVEGLESRLDDCDDQAVEMVKLREALEQIEGCHRTFDGGRKDIRGQHCLDLERIARAALQASSPKEPR